MLNHDNKTASLNTPETWARRPIIFGAAVMAAFFGVFGGWSLLAEIGSAAVAPGVLTVESSRKTIKHLEGGVVSQILVAEGESVSEGQPLFLLNQTEASARLELLKSREATTRARIARLVAERDSKDRIEFPAEIADAPKGGMLAQVRADEEAVFETRRSSLQGEISILEQQVAAAKEEIPGLEVEIKSLDSQLALVKEEKADIETLYKKGFARKPRLLALARNVAEVEGARGRTQAEMARVRQRIAETRIKIREIGVRNRRDVVEALGEANSELADMSERLRVASDVMTRTSITAPITGTAVALKAHTVGGVIQPGEALVDIVPAGEQLLVDARVDPKDIDTVYAGLSAQVRLTAYNQRNARPIFGEVVSVSADRLEDAATGQKYFLARVKLDLQSAVREDVELKPGMQADVFILTGERTPFDYLTAPLTRSIEKSMLEG
jgi:HlyD family type I secretion membrane fusion protein